MSKDQLLKKIASYDNNFEFAEFISSKTDTRQRIGELFIYTPTKLECIFLFFRKFNFFKVFRLRSQFASTRIPNFKHPEAMFELSNKQTSEHTFDTSKLDCMKCNQSLTKILKESTFNKQPLILSQPQLIPTKKKSLASPPKREITHHEPLRRKGLPPLLMQSQAPVPPFSLQCQTPQHEIKQMGRMCYGRLSEGVDYELMKIMTRETTIPKKVEKPLNKKLSTKKLNLLRTKTSALSKHFKEQFQLEKHKYKQQETEQIEIKESEINKIIYGC